MLIPQTGVYHHIMINMLRYAVDKIIMCV